MRPSKLDNLIVGVTLLRAAVVNDSFMKLGLSASWPALLTAFEELGREPTSAQAWAPTVEAPPTSSEAWPWLAGDDLSHSGCTKLADKNGRPV